MDTPKVTAALVAIALAVAGGSALLNKEPAFDPDKGFTLDDTLVKRVVIKGNNREAVVEYYGADGSTVKRVQPISKDSIEDFQDAVDSEAKELLRIGQLKRKQK